MNNKNQKGFTLIELLVVIAIIGLLSTMSVVALNTARQKSRDAKRLSDMKQVQTALELYYSDQNRYPATLAFGGTNQVASGTRIYMAATPSNPSPRTDGSSPACTDSNYLYVGGTGGTTYNIYYCIGDATGGLPAGIHHATPAGLY
ncbi:MAG: type II secretion system protein [Patescibacteria group bacterium]|jgi:prepilin-type N-terminal cleavage/methylation domain-containing protein